MAPTFLMTLEPFVRGYFTPNANYWRGQPKVDLEYSYITDSAVAFEAYKNNEFDIIALAAEDLATVQQDPVLSKEAKIYPGSCTFAVMFHQLKEPFTDQKVREAFAMSFDREAWVTDVLKGLGSPTLTWIPPGYPGYDAAENRWGFDPEAAKAALAESSYGSVEGLPPITLTFSDTPRNRTRNEWLAAKWKENLGVDLALDPVEFDHLHRSDQGHHHRAADVHPGLVRGLPRSPELAERLLEDRRLRRAHRLLERRLRRPGQRGRHARSIRPSAPSSTPRRRPC